MSTTVLDTAPETIIAEESPAGLMVGPEPRAAGDRAAWRTEAQSAAWQKFESLPMPARHEEAWRFSSIKSLDLTGFTVPAPVPGKVAEDLLNRSVGLDACAGRMVFANEELLSRESRNESLKQKGVIWLPLEDAAREHPELFRKHFMQEEVQLGSRKFAALHETWARQGTFLYVPRGVEIDLPVESFHWLHGEASSCFPHTLIVADENSKVTLVDYFQSSDESTAGFACGVNDLWLGTGAKVTYV